MPSNPSTTSPADLAAEANGLLTGLGVLTIQLFPFSLPLLVLVIGPLALLAVPLVLLAGLVILPVWLVRLVLRSRSRRASRRRPARWVWQAADG
jgi:Flp pilus assembly protein TadB